MALSGSMSEALKILESSPAGAMQLTLRGTQVKKELKKLAKKQREPWKSPLIRPLTDFSFPTLDLNKALIIQGRSNLGKSSLAVSLCPTALICSTLEDLNLLTSKNGGIIFDDMGVPKDREVQLALVDLTKPTSIGGVRYKNPRIPSGTIRIWTTNLQWFAEWNQSEEVTRRIQVIEASSEGCFRPIWGF